MALTTKAQIVEFLGLGAGELSQQTESLLGWIISSIESHIKTRTGLSKFEPEGANIKAITIAFVDSDPDTITDSGSGFVTAGFVAGDVIAVSGSSNNDGVYTIATVVAGTITLVATDALTAEAAGANVKIAVFKPITEYHDGDGETGVIWVDEFPVTAVASLHDDNVYPHTYVAGYLVSTDDYIWYADGRIELVSGTFNAGLKNIKVVYTAGYTTVPSDLEFLATKWAALAFKEKDHLGWSSQGAADGSMTVFDRYLDPGMMAILNSYTDRAAGFNL